MCKALCSKVCQSIYDSWKQDEGGFEESKDVFFMLEQTTKHPAHCTYTEYANITIHTYHLHTYIHENESHIEDLYLKLNR